MNAIKTAMIFNLIALYADTLLSHDAYCGCFTCEDAMVILDLYVAE